MQVLNAEKLIKKIDEFKLNEEENYVMGVKNIVVTISKTYKNKWPDVKGTFKIHSGIIELAQNGKMFFIDFKSKYLDLQFRTDTASAQVDKTHGFLMHFGSDAYLLEIKP